MAGPGRIYPDSAATMKLCALVNRVSSQLIPGFSLLVRGALRANCKPPCFMTHSWSHWNEAPVKRTPSLYKKPLHWPIPGWSSVQWKANTWGGYSPVKAYWNIRVLRTHTHTHTHTHTPHPHMHTHARRVLARMLDNNAHLDGLAFTSRSWTLRCLANPFSTYWIDVLILLNVLSKKRQDKGNFHRRRCMLWL